MDTLLGYTKEFLILYLLLTVFVHLAATEKHKKYIHFFAGIVLVLVLLSPVSRLLGRDGGLAGLAQFEDFFEELDNVYTQADGMEYLQKGYEQKAYSGAIEQGLCAQARARGYPVKKARVTLRDDYGLRRVCLWTDQKLSDAQKNGLVKWLGDTYQIGGKQLIIYG